MNSEKVEKALQHTAYKCPYTGGLIDLKNRVVEEKVLDEYTCNTQSFFHPLDVHESDAVEVYFNYKNSTICHKSKFWFRVDLVTLRFLT